MPDMKTTENILYCSLIPFEKKCTEKSLSAFKLFLFLVSGEGIVKVHISC